MKAGLKKAQLGKIIKKGIKAVEKETPYIDMMPTPEYHKKGLKMAIERRVNPEAAKKKMTKVQRQSFEVDDSYRKNGGAIKKANCGTKMKKK